jgi:hypothetical protein
MARRRQIRNELRSNLIDAAQRVGAKEAIRQLGDLQTLAVSYLELYRGRFDFQTGAAAAVLTYAALQVVGIALILAFHAGVEATGVHAGTYSLQFWSGFGPYNFSVSADGRQFSMLLLSPAHLLLMAVAFAIGSSLRLVFARRQR